MEKRIISLLALLWLAFTGTAMAQPGMDDFILGIQHFSHNSVTLNNPPGGNGWTYYYTNTSQLYDDFKALHFNLVHDGYLQSNFNAAAADRVLVFFNFSPCRDNSPAYQRWARLAHRGQNYDIVKRAKFDSLPPRR